MVIGVQPSADLGLGLWNKNVDVNGSAKLVHEIKSPLRNFSIP